MGYKQKSIATDTEMKLRYISAILIAATCAGAAFGARKSNARATKITPEELLQQAQTEFTGYNFEGALEKLEEYEAAQQKAKKPLSDEYHSLLNRVQTGTSMLDRVEDVEIIDSLTVDADKFFRYYRLSEPSGRITDSSSLPSDANPWPGSTAYVTENGETAIWSSPDKNGHAQLVQSTMLVDGSWETPTPLGSSLNMGGNAIFPYLMSDGVTLYYTSDGDGSLGGYDIFITRNDGEKYLQPQNVGMPYNSPANDYLLAIDELTGAGWWATDRNAPEGKVTIYVYVPRDVRKNYSVDCEDLVSLARVNSIAATREKGRDYSEIVRRINSIGTNNATAKGQNGFSFALPTGKVCKRMGDFHSVEGRRAMKAYLLYEAELERTQQRTEALRARYAKGDTSVAEDILLNESREQELRNELKAKAAEVIHAECDNQ